MAQDLKEPSLRSNRKSSKASSNRSSPIIGSGHMADLTRAFDWKGTALGAAETWPDTLLTTVNLLLASRHPMFLWWGPELVQFYNDGYRPSIRGDKHPSALGQRGADCWPEIWPIIGPQIEAVMSRGQSTWNTNQLVPINRNGKLEEVFWTYGYSPVRDKDGSVQGTLVVQSEILDRKRAEISLRELTGRLLRAQDEERRHMARELHDHAGQTLVAMALNLEALLQDGDHAPRSIRIIKEVQKLSDDLSKEIRTLSYLLHPPLLDEVGLTSALRFYVEGFSKRSKIEVDLELPEDASRLSKAQELIVFRVVQESLTNVHRHSGSQWAKIQLSQSSSMVKIEIVDKGKGISSEEPRVLATARMGVGVRGMEERVRQFGGSFQIESGTAGTRVSATIPLIPK